MILSESHNKSLIKFLFVLLFFVVPLLFFTNLTRNPYYFQITLLNILVSLFYIFYVYHSYKAGKMLFPNNPVVYIFILLIFVFFLSSVYSYYGHNDFFKPSILSEFRRIWLYTIFNAFLVFLIPFFIPVDDKYEGESFFVFVILWGVLWFLFPFLKTDASNFFDFYGFLLWAAGVFYLYLRFKNIEHNFLMNIFILSGIMASLYGVLQYFGIEFIWHKLVNPYGRRAVSTFGNPNFVSSYVMMLFPVSMFYYLQSKSKFNKFYYLFSMISYLLMIFASLTRSSIIGLIFSVVVLFSFSEYRKSLNKKIKELKKIFLIIILLAILWPDQNLKPLSFGVVKRLYVATKNVVLNAKMSASEENLYPSFHQRLLIWNIGLLMFKENPVTGKGWGSFELFYPFYQGHLLREYPNLKTLRTHANNAHNEIIEILSQTGIVGFGISILLFLSLFYNLKKYLKFSENENNKLFVISLFSSIVGMLVDNMFNVSIHFAVPGLLFFWILGLLSSILYKNNYLLIKTNLLIKFLMAISVVLLVLHINFWKNQFLREVYYFKGFKEMRKGNYALAKISLEKAFNYDQREVNNNYELANCYVKNDELEKAIWMYKEAINTNAGYDEIYFNLAVIENKIGRVKDSIDNLRMSVWINPTSINAYYMLLTNILKNNDYTLAFHIGEDAIKNYKYESKFYSYIGYLYEIKNDIKQAAIYYEKALILSPYNKKYILNYERVKKFSDKKGYIDRFLLLYNKLNNPAGKININDVFKEVESLENVFGKELMLEYLKAKTYFLAGDYEKSKKILKYILSENDRLNEARYGLAVIYEKENDTENAIKQWEKFLSYEPDNNIVKDRIDKLKKMK